MFRKVAIALVAASMFAAPVMAQAPAADSKPAATAPATPDSSAGATTRNVKAHKSTVKSNKHSRAMRTTRIVSHKSVKAVKHARHFNGGNTHKVAGTANKVVSAKSATRSSAN